MKPESLLPPSNRCKQLRHVTSRLVNTINLIAYHCFCKERQSNNAVQSLRDFYIWSFLFSKKSVSSNFIWAFFLKNFKKRLSFELFYKSSKLILEKECDLANRLKSSCLDSFFFFSLLMNMNDLILRRCKKHIAEKRDIKNTSELIM